MLLSPHFQKANAALLMIKCFENVTFCSVQFLLYSVGQELSNFFFFVIVNIISIILDK